MVDHDCVAYSNTVEIILGQQEQLHTVKSFNVMTTLLYYYSIVDIWTKVQAPVLDNKSGSQVVL